MPESKKKRSEASKKAWRTREREGKTRTRRVYERSRRSVRRRVGKPHLIQMLLFGLLGYETGNILNKSGISGYLYNHNNTWKKFIDSGYKYSPEKFSNGGGSGVALVAGAGLGGDAIYKSMKSGKVSGKALNMELPFLVGAILDPPPNSGGSSGSDW